MEPIECPMGYCDTLLTTETINSPNQPVCNDCKTKLGAIIDTPGQSGIKMVLSLINGVRKRHPESTLTREDIMAVWPADYKCPIMGTPFLNESITGNRSQTPSLDRIDSSKGYEIGNIQVISNLANRMKQNASPEQLRTFALYFLQD